MNHQTSNQEQPSMNDNTLDQILYHLARRVQQNEPLELDGVKAQIIQMVMEIIGQNDKYDYRGTKAAVERYNVAYERNKLREEQRERARKYGLEIEG